MNSKEILLKKADAGDANAALVCGWHCVLGDNGFEQNDEKAKEWFEKAIELGSIDGFRLIGFLYERNFNIRKAIDYYKKGGLNGDRHSGYIALSFMKFHKLDLILSNQINCEQYERIENEIEEFQKEFNKFFENKFIEEKTRN